MRTQERTGVRKPTIRLLRDASLWALPAVSVAAAALFELFPDAVAFDWLFKIALSGTVGIWTNYFAIKMLFRPRRPSVFGIQGLIPANRRKLAAAIGQTVADELLAPEQVFAFIEKNSIIEKLGTEALKLVHNELDKPTSREWLKQQAGRLLRKATAENVEEFLVAAIGKIRQLAGEKLVFSSIWASFRTELEKQLSEGPIHDALARVALGLAGQHAPDAARWINQQIDEYIESRGWVVRHALKMGKWAFRVNEAKITGYMTSRIESPSFGPSIIRAIESLAPEVSRLMENPQIRRASASYFEKQKLGVMSWLETEGLAQGKAMVLEVMDSDKFWRAIEGQVDRGIPALVNWAATQFETPGFRSKATPFLRSLASHVPIADIVEDRVDNFDLDELEGMIYRVTSENLAGIEFLGGVLGCIAGLVLIRQWMMLPMAAAVLVVVVLGSRGKKVRR